MEIKHKDIILRSWSEANIDELVLIANNKSIADNLRDAFPHPYLKSDAVKWISSVLQNQKSNTFFAILNENKIVGSIGIVFKDDIYRKNAEIGYFIGKEYNGRGFATKSIEAIVKYVFSEFDINKIYAEPMVNNIASIKVLEKNGFECEAVLKQSIIKNDVIMDSCIYSVLNKNYKNNTKINE